MLQEILKNAGYVPIKYELSPGHFCLGIVTDAEFQEFFANIIRGILDLVLDLVESTDPHRIDFHELYKIAEHFDYAGKENGVIYFMNLQIK